jgi:hypothetical protein
MLASWQLLHPAVTPLWIWAPVGAGVANLVLDVLLPVADAGINPLTLLVLWHEAHTVDEGMCELAPIGLVGGMPIKRLMPVNGVVLPAGW